MDGSSSSSSSQPQARRSPRPATARYRGRVEILRAVHALVNRAFFTAVRRRQRQGQMCISAVQRALISRKAVVVEDILYRRAATIEEYRDAGTLEARVREAWRIIRVTKMERERRRRAAASAVADDNKSSTRAPALTMGDTRRQLK